MCTDRADPPPSTRQPPVHTPTRSRTPPSTCDNPPRCAHGVDVRTACRTAARGRATSGDRSGRQAWVRYRRAMRLAPLLVTAVLAAGCTTVVAGTPSAPPGILLPPRPKEVRLDGVDPCSLLTAEQRRELGFESAPRNGTIAASALYRGDVPICTMRGFTGQATSVGIGMVTTAGIDLWTTGALDADITPATVRGFPAVVAVPRRFTEYCSVDVDVAPGQLIDVQLGDGGNRPRIPQHDLCSRAVQTAEAAVASLLAR